MSEKIKNWIVQNIQLLINIYLFINILGVIAWQTHGLYQRGHLNLIEITFILNNGALAWVVLVRQKHVSINHNPWQQLIALIAFFSGIAFIGEPSSEQPLLSLISQALLLIASLLGLLSIFHLKDSFGILIAYRSIKTQGLYRYVRHPMYATDILLRIGYLVSHFNPITMLLFALSTGCYAYRAILEEDFLSSQTDTYMTYKKQVPYRFIPGLI